jgi:hypothetical protein
MIQFENFNMMGDYGPGLVDIKASGQAMFESHEAVFSGFADASASVGTSLNPDDHERFHDQFIIQEEGDSAVTNPHSFLSIPVFEEFNALSTSKVVGRILAIVPWDRYVAGLLPDGVEGIHVVLENSCGESVTYLLVGSKVRVSNTCARSPNIL